MGPARALYFSCHALARLGAVAALRLNDSEAGLAPDELASAAAGCNIIVASRELAVPAAVFQALPDLVAVCPLADMRGMPANSPAPATKSWPVAMTADQEAGVMASGRPGARGFSPE
ncbi:hypothetical protein [Cupriavidus basilensis]|uniref:hypothetical protein n=1 Tax=Cupriavidus basilensis TaxID=68895 RepID=UPI0023E7B3CE|nr:hypothetical protein [Cupriavidus basilensis]MDF3884237.1 hypothetical protein [Cupriavidus basilensis]